MRRLTPQQKEALPLLRAAKAKLKNPYAGAIQKAIDLIEGADGGTLTNLHFDALPVGESLVDPKHPGLILKNGARTGKRWIFRTTKIASATRVEIPIGPYPGVSIEEARQHRAAMAKERSAGRMPKSPAISATGKARTVGDLFDWYQREYCKLKRPSSALSDRRIIERHITPHWKDLPLEEWTADKIDAVVQSLFNATGKGRQAEKLRAVISTVNNAARGQSKRWTAPIDIVSGIPNPMLHVRNLPDRKMIPSKRRENYKPKLPEMRAVVGNAAKALDPTAADAILLQVYTCARISEVVGLPWSEIDLEAGTWTLPGERAKNATEHVVLLSRQALNLLERRRAADPAGEWVFPYKGGHLARDRMIRALAGKRGALGVSDRFTSHAIRHACLSWCASNGIGREVRDRISNHRPPASVDSEYVEAELDEPAARALQRWSDAVTGATGKVVRIGERA